VLVRQESQQSLEDLVEGLAEAEEEVVVVVEVVPVVHQAVLQVAVDPGVPLLVVLVVLVDLVDRVVGLPDRMDRPLSLMDLVGVLALVLAFWGDLTWAGFSGRTLGLPSVGIAREAVVMMGWSPLVGMVPGIGWKIPLY
jgi:hypothetical protein